MESLGIIKPTSDKITKFPEEWIAYINYGNGYTENIIVLDSHMEMFAWIECHCRKRWDGYYYKGNKIHVKKKIKL